MIGIVRGTWGLCHYNERRRVLQAESFQTYLDCVDRVVYLQKTGSTVVYGRWE